MNVKQIGRNSYLWHLKKAANWDHIAATHEQHGFLKRAEDAHAEARRHREKAAILRLERVA